MTKKIYWLLLLWSSATLYGQNDKLIQLNFPSTQYSQPLSYTDCDSNGICVLYKTPLSAKDSTTWHILYYDTDFNLIHQVAFTLPNTQTHIASAYYNGKLAILYRNVIKRRKNYTGCLAHYNIFNRTLTVEDVHDLPEGNLKQVKIYDHHLLLVCPFDGGEENLFYYTLGTNHFKPLTIKDAPPYNVQDYLFDTTTQKVIVCLNTKPNTHNRNVLWLCKTDYDGHLTFVIDFPDTLSERFQSAKIRQIGSSEYLAFGTYQNRWNESVFYSSAGIYAIHFQDVHFDKPQLYPFENGKPPAEVIFSNCNIQYFISDVIQNGDQFSVISESYYPIYSYSPSTMMYGGTYMTKTLVGYNFINAYVKTIDPQCNLIWEYTFPYDNMQVSSVGSHLKVSFLNHNILFYYLTGVKLISLLTDETLAIIAPLQSTLMVPKKDENTTATAFYTESRITHWYGNNYTFATRKSYKARKRIEGNSTYYINKLKFE